MSTPRSTSKRPRRCKAKTQAGKRCRAAPLKGADHCIAHSTRSDKDALGFGGPQLGSGPRRRPPPHERLRELVEEEETLKAIVDTFHAAITETVVFAKYEGEVIPSEHPDHGARIAAARELLDRVYGKPRQELELAGSETGPTLSIVAVDEREISDAAREFLAKLIPPG